MDILSSYDKAFGETSNNLKSRGTFKESAIEILLDFKHIAFQREDSSRRKSPYEGTSEVKRRYLDSKPSAIGLDPWILKSPGINLRIPAGFVSSLTLHREQ